MAVLSLPSSLSGLFVPCHSFASDDALFRFHRPFGLHTRFICCCKTNLRQCNNNFSNCSGRGILCTSSRMKVYNYTDDDRVKPLVKTVLTHSVTTTASTFSTSASSTASRAMLETMDTPRPTLVTNVEDTSPTRRHLHNVRTSSLMSHTASRRARRS